VQQKVSQSALLSDILPHAVTILGVCGQHQQQTTCAVSGTSSMPGYLQQPCGVHHTGSSQLLVVLLVLLCRYPAYLHITDIAGLVRGASEGAGLGNAFLSHIAAVDGIFHVVSSAVPCCGMLVAFLQGGVGCCSYSTCADAGQSGYVCATWRMVCQRL
jgi:hypothetical protein